MSLLLEALKKAEKAKEEAKRRANGELQAAETSRTTSSGPSPAPTMAENKGLVTRDRLPDVSSTPLEIVNDDLAPPRAAAPPRELEPGTEPAQSAATSSRRAAATNDEAGRSAAKKVFEAKFREPNPRMPFYITLSVLGLFAVGTVVYFWYQLRPPAPLVNLNPPRNTAEAAIAEAPRTPSTAAPAPAPAREPVIPGLPAKTDRHETPRPPAAAAPVKRELRQAPRPPVGTAPPSREKPQIAAKASRAAAPVAAATTSRAVLGVNPNVEAGYAAYLAGDMTKARSAYLDALREESGNRDALLGLAALDVRDRRLEAAEALYLRVLESDPRDAEAQAALLSLRAGRSDPLANESRVKSLLAVEPGAHVLNFALGNQLALQNRWAEAQREYMKAYSAEPDNADFAYNVAVSFDHLHQPELALDYYHRALALARERGASFDLAAVQARVAQLGR